jgi:hypothetical protein
MHLAMSAALASAKSCFRALSKTDNKQYNYFDSEFLDLLLFNQFKLRPINVQLPGV